MLEDMIHLRSPAPQPQLSIEDISSPITAQMFEFGEDDFFPETLRNFEVTSCSKYCYEDNSSYTPNPSFSSSVPSDVSAFNNNSSSSSNNNNNNSISSISGINNGNINTNNNFSVMCDPQDDNGNLDLCASMNFLSTPTFSIPPPTILNQEEQFEMSTMQLSVPLTDVVNGLATPYQPDLPVSLKGVPLSLGFGDGCLSSLPYGNLDPSSPSCSLMDPSMGQFLPGTMSTTLSVDTSAIYSGNILMGNELQPHELEFQGENIGGYGSDSVQQCYSSGDMQQSHQQLVTGVGSSAQSSEISNLEESNYKVGRLSAEERKERIHRYMKKRNERNFSKKIKYACRKTLADSRPRVRGRFAKNDDFGEVRPYTSSNHEDEDDEEVTVKEEDDIVDSDIFAHISGVNSFKTNYQVQSWI